MELLFFCICVCWSSLVFGVTEETGDEDDDDDDDVDAFDDVVVVVAVTV